MKNKFLSRIIYSVYFGLSVFELGEDISFLFSCFLFNSLKVLTSLTNTNSVPIQRCQSTYRYHLSLAPSAEHICRQQNYRFQNSVDIPVLLGISKSISV